MYMDFLKKLAIFAQRQFFDWFLVCMGIAFPSWTMKRGPGPNSNVYLDSLPWANTVHSEYFPDSLANEGLTFTNLHFNRLMLCCKICFEIVWKGKVNACCILCLFSVYNILIRLVLSKGSYLMNKMYR